MMQPLDLASFPLDGIRLIEASAGTGKTYTIANLYLRLILERQLEVPQILVVTFTNAATEELRSRIRKRLAEAHRYLANGLAGEEEDKELGRLVRCVADRLQAMELLEAAMTRMDEASVFTIHGFAQRILKEQAFESGALFDSELLGDESILRRSATEDFWRQRFYGASEDEVAWALKEWGTPDGLHKKILGVLDRDAVRILPEVAPDHLLNLETDWHRLRDRLLEAWRQQGGAVCDVLRNDPGLNRNSYRPAVVDRAIVSFQTWLMKASPGYLPDKFDLFTPVKLASATKKGHDTPTGILFDLCGELVVLAPKLASARRAALLTEATSFTRAAVAEYKHVRNQISYDDLLKQLSTVLAGPEARGLVARVLMRYPVAMIDEFQDTDPLQYRIFRTIYTSGIQPVRGPSEKHSETQPALFMIGDPKQAIYGFRGADIFAYLKARLEIGDGAYTLTTNWRSSSALIDAVNRIYGAVPMPFLYDGIEFHPVAPSLKADDEPLKIENTVPSPLACWWLPRQEDKPLPVGEARQRAAMACTHEIARLLTLSAQGEASLGSRPLAARDIAILVRDRFEASVVRSALDEAGIPSVFLSRDSVFATPEAEALRRLLRAVAEPGNARILRAALATDLIGVDAMTLESLNHDEMAWETWLNHFHEANQRWREQGFMAMFTQLLIDCAITHRLLAAHGGERRMTNLLQLGELLMVAANERIGFESLLRWVDLRIAEPDGNDETQQLRLESEESLVQVVTIHASKGLEYPLVFLPFPWSSRKIDTDKIAKGCDPFLFHAKEDRVLCADLGTEIREENAHLAEQERLAEDLRLLYVALTRARQRVYLSWGVVSGAKDSALSRLLHGGKGMEGLDDETIRSDLLKFNEEAQRLVLEELPDKPLRASVSPQAGLVHVRHFTGYIDSGWRVSSYSGLVSGNFDRGELPDYDTPLEMGEEPILPERLQQDRVNFPHGAQAGLFLHGLLEKLDFPHAQEAVLSLAVHAGLQMHGFESSWKEPIETWIRSILDTPLDDDGLRLRNIRRSDRLDELAFYYPLASLESDAVNALLTRHGSLELEGERLSFSPLRGMMKGFVDLVFRHEGRFFIADYKSNYLGEGFEDYAPSRLAEAMREHRYDLQYLIYCVALHRYLRMRVPGYLYKRDFGGVYYLFLRGMHPDHGPGKGIWFDRPEAALIEALDALFSGRMASA